MIRLFLLTTVTFLKTRICVIEFIHVDHQHDFFFHETACASLKNCLPARSSYR